MRVLIVSPFFPPLLSVASLRAWSFAAGFAREGHDVSVLTTAKRADQAGLNVSDPLVRVFEVEPGRRHVLESIRRAHAQPAGTHVPGGGRGLLRGVKERTGVFSSVRMPDLTDAWVAPAGAWARSSGPFDLVVSSSGPYTAHLAALRMGSARGAWIADYRDLWTGNHHFAGLYPFTVRERALERRLFREADAVTTVSEPLAEQLRRAGARRVEVIYNGHFEREPEPVPAEPAFPSDGLMRVVYTGSVYPKHQNLGGFFAGLAALRERADLLRVVVAGSGAGHWRAVADGHGVGRLLDFRGSLPRPQALAMQRDAGALLAVEFTGTCDGVLSGKIFEYLACEAPVLVAGGRGCVGDLVERTGRGRVLTTPDDVRSALAALLDGHGLGAGPRQDTLISALSRERQAERLCALGRSLSPGAGRPAHAL